MVSLKGKGTDLPGEPESKEALHLYITATTEPQLAHAKALAQNLLQAVRRDWNTFLDRKEAEVKAGLAALNSPWASGTGPILPSSRPQTDRRPQPPLPTSAISSSPASNQLKAISNAPWMQMKPNIPPAVMAAAAAISARATGQQPSSRSGVSTDADQRRKSYERERPRERSPPRRERSPPRRERSPPRRAPSPRRPNDRDRDYERDRLRKAPIESQSRSRLPDRPKEETVNVEQKESVQAPSPADILPTEPISAKDIAAISNAMYGPRARAKPSHPAPRPTFGSGSGHPVGMPTPGGPGPSLKAGPPVSSQPLAPMSAPRPGGNIPAPPPAEAPYRQQDTYRPPQQQQSLQQQLQQQQQQQLQLLQQQQQLQQQHIT